MKSLSRVGLALSIVFGCLLLALVAELYYLLWWKKRFVSRDIENDYSNPAREFFCMFCWKRPSSSLSHKALNPQEIRIRDSLAQEAENSNRNLLLKPFDDDGLETELTGLHPFPGPPRFLFTIVEETKEDLESEDGKSRKASRGRSLSDILLTVETPYLTPFASPPFFTPPLTPLSVDSSYSHSHTHQQGFNPLFESVTDAEFNRIRSSPPPKFKFLQDAEEKLYRRKLMEETPKNDELVQENGSRSSCSSLLKDEDEGSFITIIVDGNSERGFLHENHHQHPQFHSGTSQVLPLSSSPSKFQPPVTNKLK